MSTYFYIILSIYRTQAFESRKSFRGIHRGDTALVLFTPRKYLKQSIGGICPDIKTRTWERFAYSGGCIFLIYCFYPLRCLCYDFMATLLWLAVDPRSLYWWLFTKLLNVCPFDYTYFYLVNGNGEIPWTGLTTSVWWLLLLQLTFLSRSVIVV